MKSSKMHSEPLVIFMLALVLIGTVYFTYQYMIPNTPSVIINDIISDPSVGLTKKKLATLSDYLIDHDIKNQQLKRDFLNAVLVRAANGDLDVIARITNPKLNQSEKYEVLWDIFRNRLTNNASGCGSILPFLVASDKERTINAIPVEHVFQKSTDDKTIAAILVVIQSNGETHKYRDVIAGILDRGELSGSVHNMVKKILGKSGVSRNDEQDKQDSNEHQENEE